MPDAGDAHDNARALDVCLQDGSVLTKLEAARAHGTYLQDRASEYVPGHTPWSEDCRQQGTPFTAHNLCGQPIAWRSATCRPFLVQLDLFKPTATSQA